MAKTNAERQAAFKAKRIAGQVEERQLNTWISADAFFALRRMARHRGITRRAIIEELLRSADQEIADSMNEQQHDKYVTVTK